MARSVCWLLFLLMAAAFGGGVAVLLRDRALAGHGMPAYSVYSDAGDGLGEAAHLLRALGWTPVALDRPVQNSQARGLLLLVEPDAGGPLDEDGVGSAGAEALLRWVGEGNTLLLAGRKNTALHHALGLLVTEGEEAFTPAQLDDLGPYGADVAALSVGSEATLRAPPGARVLWRVAGQPGAVLLRHGRGHVLVLADPALLTRQGLIEADGQARADNVLFLVNVVRRAAVDGRVWFDEYHHGLRAGGGFWNYLAYHGRRWAVLPVLLVVGVALWRRAVRLGPAVPRPVPVRADAVAYASALARLYHRAGARRLVGRVLVRDFLAALARHLHLRRVALPALMLAAWRQRYPAGGPAGTTAERLQELLRGVGELRKGDVGDRQMLTWARAFDQFRHDLEADGGRAPARPAG